MTSPEAEAFMDAVVAMRKNSPRGSQTLAERRESSKILGLLASQPAGVTERPVVAGGVPAFWVEPDSSQLTRPNHVLLYLHGGGYIVGSAESYGRFAGHLASRLGSRVLNLDYRLAPEHPHPAQVHDGLAAYRWLLDQGYSPSQVAVSGDSAGGGLVVTTLLAIREAGLPQPCCAVPLSPWTDLQLTGNSMTTNADIDKMVDPSSLTDTVAMFLGDEFLTAGSTTDPLASPLYADLSDLAPMYVQVGEHEVLLDDSLRLVDAVVSAGGSATVEVFAEMHHTFQISCGQIPEATDATNKIAAYITEQFDD